jgi:hypothetical protein
MIEAIVVAFITGGLTLAGTIVTSSASNSKTIYRIDQLEKVVEKHNNVIDRTYRLEQDVAVIKEKLVELSKGE